MQDLFISGYPFGHFDRAPVALLEDAGFRIRRHPFERRLTADELADSIRDVDVLIAGTEPITAAALGGAPRLRLISRVGIGLDNVDLAAARERGIAVAYTPDAPGPAVAELTIGLMVALLRGVHHANALMHQGTWKRLMGRRLAELTVGVIGVGRIGGEVIRLLAPFGCRVLANDVREVDAGPGVEIVGKDLIYRAADVLTVHVPLTPQTLGMIGAEELALMKPDAVIVNTARGGIIDEHALAEALRDGRLAGAALDVFEAEPYRGELSEIDTCLLTCHMGSMSQDCRRRMEYEAALNAVRFARGEPGVQFVPETEYAMHASAR